MQYILFCTFIILLSSCGKKTESTKKETPIVQSEIEQVMDRQQFDCASLSGAVCPSGMARLLIINPENPDRSSACSGFMVGPRKMVTNHHCIATQSICENTYVAVYDGNKYHKARCERLIKSKQDVDDPNNPRRKLDYAVVEIDRSFVGGYFTLSENPASDGDKVKAWVIDHTGLDLVPSNLFESRITELECEVSPSERESLFMVNCPIISGNSGSPLLNSRDQIVGVIWGGNANIIDSTYDLDMRRALDAVGLATEVNYFRDYVMADLNL